MSKNNPKRKELGVALVEYSLALTILLAVFIASAYIIKIAGKYRGDQSMKIGETTLPCEAGLSPEQCI